MSVLTVIMPVYNGEKFLKESIDSVLSQSFTDFTLLIINDNSNDNSQKIIDSYLSSDDRVLCLKNDINLGPATSRNRAIESAKTEFIALMDADDLALPTRFEKQYNYLKAQPEIGVCGTWFTFFGEKNKLVRHSVDHEKIKVGFLSSCVIANPTVMFRKSVLGELRFEHQYVPAEDYGLWSQLIGRTNFHNIPEPLLLYRWHPNNISQTKADNLRKAEAMIRAKQLEHLGVDMTDIDLKHYIAAVSLKRKQTIVDIIKTIIAANKLKVLNKKTEYYNQDIFEAHIEKTVVRTIRNARNNDWAFYKFLKNDSGYFSKLPILDRIILFFKCLF